MRKLLLRILFMLCLVFIMLPGTTQKVSASTVIAEVNGESYTDLQLAFNNVEGGTIKLVSNVNLGSYITNSSSNSFTLDLNGKEIRSGVSAIYHDGVGTLTITDSSDTKSGKIIGAGEFGAINLWASNLTVTGGTIQNASGPGIVNEAGGNIYIPSGTVTVISSSYAMSTAPIMTDYSSYQWRVTSSSDFSYYTGGESWAQAYLWSQYHAYVEIRPYTYVPTPLTGTVTINGATKFEQTLTANYGSGNNTGNLSYQWKRGSENIGTNSASYTLVEADIDKTITCTVTSTAQTGSVVSSPTSVTKADGLAVEGVAAVNCASSSNNDGKLTGVTTAMEYKQSGAASYTTGTGSDITGLTNGTYLVRRKETTTHFAGADSSFTVGAYVAPATYYNVWVGGVQVSSANKDNITGAGIAGTVTYNPDTKTLALNGATITGAYTGFQEDGYNTKYAIYSNGDMNIVLIGNNTVTGVSESGIYSFGIGTPGALTISGLGSVAANGGNLARASIGIHSSGNITIESGTVSAIGGNATSTSIGMRGRVIRISGGTVSATANSLNAYGLFGNNYTGDTVIITGGTVTATARSTNQSGFAKAIFGTFAASNGIVSASTNYDGSGAVPYDAANLTTYRYLKYEYMSASTTPTVDTTTITKTSMAQASVSFTLTNSPAYADNQTWKVYTDATGATLASGVTAVNSGNTLTLIHSTNIPAATYYVSVTESGKTESGRLALTIGAYIPTPLTGTVTISGATKFGQTLIAIYASGNNTGTLSYQWKRGSENIGTNLASYTLVEADVSQTITCTVTSTEQAGSVVSSPTSIAKADGPTVTGVAAVNCTSSSNNDGKLTGVTTAMEYKKNGAASYTPGTGSDITGLTNGTYLVHMKETTTHNAGGDRSFTVGAYVAPVTVPGAPTVVTATAGNGQATITFNAPALNGGAAITGYTVTSNPGGLTETGNTTTLIMGGLTNGTSYTFTVTATNSAGTGLASAASNSVTPKAGQAITFNNPGAQNFGTPLTLIATSSSGLPVTFTSAIPSVCTITSDGVLTFHKAGTASIEARQEGNDFFLPAIAIRNFTVNAVVPGAPTIGTATAGNGQATITFNAPAFTGGAAITGYTVTSNPGGHTATGASSPITVTGLTIGTSYTFTVTATNSAGTSSASSPSNTAIPKGMSSATTNPATNITTTTATLNGAVNANGASTEYRFEYGITHYYGSFSEWQNIGSSSDDNSVSFVLTGLIPGTIYHYRVVSRSEYGTINGSDKSFKTLPVVSDFDLTGKLTAPATGGTPVTTITDTQYAGSVSWSTTPQKFLGSTVYTATVTLTATSDYSFTGVNQNAFSYTGATSVTNEAGSGNTMVVTIEFPATAPRALQMISIIHEPTKTSYYVGEILNTEGMVVRATYNDGTNDDNFTAYTVNRTSPLGISDSLVTVTTTANPGIVTQFGLTIAQPTQPISGSVIINGGNQFNQTLTASYTPNDGDNGTVSYQWKRDGSNIGTNSNTYTLVEADIEHTITCEVSSLHRAGSITSNPGVTVAKVDGPVVTGVAAVNCTNSNNNDGKLTGVTTAMEYKKSGAASYTLGTGSDITGLANGTYLVRVAATATHNAGADSTITVGGYVPGALTGTVTISGTTTYGQTLTATYASGNSTGTLSYQWKRGSDNIGTNSNSYTLVEADVTQTITCEVRSTEQTGFVVSGATAAIAKADGPAVSGVAAVNCTNSNNNDGKLTGVTTAMEYKLSGAASYTTGTGSDITGLANGTYLVRVAATATHNAGADSTITVGGYVPGALTGTVTISGTTTYGQTLTATYASGNSTGTLSYQWKRGSDNIGTNSNSYTLVEADVTQTITCEVRSTEQTGFVVSGATAAIAKADGPAVSGVAAAGCTSTSNNDGKLTGVTIAMEYKRSGAASYTTGTGSDITGLANGTYLVRVAATATHDAGADSTITVEAYVPSPSGNGNGSSDTNSIPKTEGKIEKDQKKDENAPTASLNDNTEDLKSKVLSESEQTQVAAGKDAKVILKIEDISASVSDEDKKQIEDKLAAQQQKATNTTLLYVDISLFKKIGDETETRVTETKGKISISIEVPENMWSTDSGVDRTYRVVRIHEGVAELLEGTYDPTTHLFTFETDRFSTYALTYQDSSMKIDESYAKLQIFRNLRLTAKAAKTSQTLSYVKVADADGYFIYGTNCGQDMTELADVPADITSYTVKNLKPATYYKYQVKAYKLIDGEKVIFMTSKIIHSVTEGKTYANPIKVTSDTISLVMTPGQSKALTCQVVLPENRKLKKHTSAIRYETSNRAIASVNSRGKITAKAKGTCYVYAYAQNGIFEEIQVTVE